MVCALYAGTSVSPAPLTVSPSALARLWYAILISGIHCIVQVGRIFESVLITVAYLVYLSCRDSTMLSQYYHVRNTPLGASSCFLIWLMHGNCGSRMEGCRLRDAQPTDNLMLILSVFVSSRSDVLPGLTCSDHSGMNRHWDFLFGSRFQGNDFRRPTCMC